MTSLGLLTQNSGGEVGVGEISGVGVPEKVDALLSSSSSSHMIQITETKQMIVIKVMMFAHCLMFGSFPM
jgi:hypothetical protein